MTMQRPEKIRIIPYVLSTKCVMCCSIEISILAELATILAEKTKPGVL